MNIKLVDLNRQYEAYKTQIDAALQNVISSSAFILGKEVSELEEQLAAFVGTKHAIGCSSGTDALVLALMAYDVQPGDEIITSAFSFIATAEAIALRGAKPVFVDIDPQTYLMDPNQIPAARSERTKGIIGVSLFGQCADYDRINDVAKQHGLFVIEDAAQSLGALYKGKKSCSLTDIGCTSFFPAKPLGGYGDGGMIFTTDDQQAQRLKSLRLHGSEQDKNNNVRVGLNARLDTLQAAVLLAKLKHFPQEIANRIKAAEHYTQHLPPAVQAPKMAGENVSVYASYVIQAPQRDELKAHLKAQGIPTAVHYPKPLPLQPAFLAQGYRAGDFPVSEEICQKVLALPLHPFITQEEQDYIVEQVASFYK